MMVQQKKRSGSGTQNAAGAPAGNQRNGKKAKSENFRGGGQGKVNLISY